MRKPGTYLCTWQWEGDFGQAYAEAILSKPLNNTTLNLIAKGKCSYNPDWRFSIQAP
jgi:hypothetical protein